MKNLITLAKIALVASAFAVQGFAEVNNDNGGGGGGGGGGSVPTNPVPDSVPTVALLGVAAVGLAAVVRRLRK